MNALKLAILFVVWAVSPPQLSAGEPLWDAHEMAFKAHYHRWVVYLYEHPQIMLSSSSKTYTGVPDYDAIVKLGRPAVPFAAAEMMKPGSEFGLFLGDAIARIMGWKPEEYEALSLQAQNQRIYDRLVKERIVKETTQ